MTLVVIDMQTSFSASAKAAPGVQRLIEQAIKDGECIIVVEYRSCGQTIKSITTALDGYDSWSIVTKTSDDGSSEVATVCRREDFPTDRFALCGVNTEHCVFYTALGLSRRFPGATIELVEDACASSHVDEWSELALRADGAGWSNYSIICTQTLVGLPQLAVE